MRRTSPYCQSKTPANAQSPVKIIQWSRGARSGRLTVSRSDDMVVTLMFRPPTGGNDEAAFDFNSRRFFDCAARSMFLYRRSELHASQNRPQPGTAHSWELGF